MRIKMTHIIFLKNFLDFLKKVIINFWSEHLGTIFQISLSSGLTLLVWGLLIKLTSLVYGTGGVGVFGLSRQIYLYLILIFTLNGQQVLINGIASEETERLKREYFTSIAGILMIFTLFLMLFLFIFSPSISRVLFSGFGHSLLFCAIIVASFFGSLQVLFQSFVSGIGDFKAIYRVNYLSALSLVLMASLLFFYSDSLSIQKWVAILFISPAFIASLLYLPSLSKGNSQLNIFSQMKFDKRIMRFLDFSKYMLISALLQNGSLLLASWAITRYLGFATAGIYYAATTLSYLYVTVIISSYSMYVLPKLSTTQSIESRNMFLRTFFKTILSIAPIIISLILILKFLIFKYIFSQDFILSAYLFEWLAVGDFFKILSYLFAYNMLAGRHFKWFIISEIVFCVLMNISILLIIGHGFSMKLISIYFLFHYFLYFLFILFFMKHQYAYTLSTRDILNTLLGLLFIIFFFILTEINDNREVHHLFYLLPSSVLYLYIINFSYSKLPSILRNSQ